MLKYAIAAVIGIAGLSTTAIAQESSCSALLQQGCSCVAPVQPGQTGPFATLSPSGDVLYSTDSTSTKISDATPLSLGDSASIGPKGSAKIDGGPGCQIAAGPGAQVSLYLQSGCACLSVSNEKGETVSSDATKAGVIGATVLIGAAVLQLSP